MFSKKLKKLIAIVIIVSMVFSNAGFTTFADSVETHTTISVSNGNVNDYRNEEKETTKDGDKRWKESGSYRSRWTYRNRWKNR